MRITCLFVGLVALAGICSTGCAAMHWNFTVGKCGKHFVPILVDHQQGPMEIHPVGGTALPAVNAKMNHATKTVVCPPAKVVDVKSQPNADCPD